MVDAAFYGFQSTALHRDRHGDTRVQTTLRRAEVSPTALKTFARPHPEPSHAKQTLSVSGIREAWEELHRAPEKRSSREKSAGLNLTSWDVVLV